jgi:hypothetical protein
MCEAAARKIAALTIDAEIKRGTCDQVFGRDQKYG